MMVVARCGLAKTLRSPLLLFLFSVFRMTVTFPRKQTKPVGRVKMVKEGRTVSGEQYE